MKLSSASSAARLHTKGDCSQRPRLRSGLTFCIMLAAAMLVFLWPGQALADKPASFDLKAAITACPAGGTVTVPPGTWTVPARVNVYKNINIVGTPGKSVLTASFEDVMLKGYDLRGVTFSGLTFEGPGAAYRTSGLELSGPIDVTMRDLTFRNLGHGLKLGSGPQSTGLVLDTFKAQQCAVPLFVANVSDSTFTNLDVQASNLTANPGHGIYLERTLRNLTFANVRITGGSGYCLHLYTESGASDHLVFDDVFIDATTGRYPLVVWGFSDVTFRNTTLIMTAKDSPCVRIHSSAARVLFDGFSAGRGDSLSRPYSDGPASGIVFRNGTYQGTTLGTGATFENVTLGASTTTTVAPTTTTVAPQTPAPAPVVITSPVHGSQVAKGTVTITATVASSQPVSSVYFYVDGVRRLVDQSAPYSCAWNSSRLASGSTHTIKVIAYNRQGKIIDSATSVVTIAGSPTTTVAPTTTTTLAPTTTTTTVKSPLISWFNWFRWLF